MILAFGETQLTRTHARDGYSERPSILPLFTESRFMISIIAADAVGFGQQFQKRGTQGEQLFPGGAGKWGDLTVSNPNLS